MINEYKIKVKSITEKTVRFLTASCNVRYWEDASVNGVKDNDGTLIPLRDGDCWRVTIDLQSGIIQDWPTGTTADIHYKVCDEGVYALLDNEKNTAIEVDGYVPSMMCPEGNGYGDYVIMEIDGDGKINNWKVDLSYFQGNHDEL